MESWSSIIQASAAVATTFLTFFIIFYAKKTIDYARVTIEEGKKNRRKDWIEKRLETVYSPLCEMIREAKVGNKSQDGRKLAKDAFLNVDEEDDYVFDEMQIEQIRELVERFGHCMEIGHQSICEHLLAGRDNDPILPVYRSTAFPMIRVASYRFEQYAEDIRTRQLDLRKELEDLTRTD